MSTYTYGIIEDSNLVYILHNILEVSHNSPIIPSLERYGCFDAITLATLPFDEIDNLYYRKQVENRIETIDLPGAYKSLLKSFIRFIYHEYGKGNINVADEFWAKQISQDHFKRFRRQESRNAFYNNLIDYRSSMEISRTLIENNDHHEENITDHTHGKQVLAHSITPQRTETYKMGNSVTTFDSPSRAVVVGQREVDWIPNSSWFLSKQGQIQSKYTNIIGKNQMNNFDATVVKNERLIVDTSTVAEKEELIVEESKTEFKIEMIENKKYVDELEQKFDVYKIDLSHRNPMTNEMNFIDIHPPSYMEELTLDPGKYQDDCCILDRLKDHEITDSIQLYDVPSSKPVEIDVIRTNENEEDIDDFRKYVIWKQIHMITKTLEKATQWTTNLFIPHLKETQVYYCIRMKGIIINANNNAEDAYVLMDVKGNIADVFTKAVYGTTFKTRIRISCINVDSPRSSSIDASGSFKYFEMIFEI